MKIKKTKMLKLPASVFGLDRWEDQIYANCMDGVYKVDSESGKFKKLGAHQSYGSRARLVDQGKTLITSGYDGVIKWFDTKKESEVRSLKVHHFWSWDMDISQDEKWIATVSGQYLAGGYKYEPAKASEPTVKIINAQTGEVKHEFEHLPPVQAVAISPDSQFVAAGNLMGEVKVWSLTDGKQVAEFQSKDLTSWGIIKSHCYIGGIYSMCFSQSGDEILIAGMGPMRDPMAGNGRQRWQAFRWKENPQKVKNSDDKECGEGLMETIETHPGSGHVVMAGRLRGGDWNLAIFDYQKSAIVQSLKTGDRITNLRIKNETKQLIVGGTVGQPSPKKKDARFGRIHLFEILT